MFKFIHKLFNTNVVDSSSQVIVISNDKTKIIYNGKEIDPKSPEGKKILSNTAKKINKTMKHFDKQMELMDKQFDEMGKMFDSFFK